MDTLYRPESAIQAHARKVMAFATAFGILEVVRRRLGFESAVLFGLAMNSADLNEAREIGADILTLIDRFPLH